MADSLLCVCDCQKCSVLVDIYLMASFAAIEAAHPIDPEVVFEAMLDTPATRRHQIILPAAGGAPALVGGGGGLWLGNQVAAGGMVPLCDRTAEYSAATLAALQADQISSVLCLAEGLECFPAELKYLQIRIADHGDRLACLLGIGSLSFSLSCGRCARVPMVESKPMVGSPIAAHSPEIYCVPCAPVAAASLRTSSRPAAS